MTPEAMAELRERLARVEEKQNALGASVDKGFSGLGEKLDRFDERVRRVETNSAISGTLAGGVVSVVVSLVAAKLKGGA
jgi:hypothetical protein